MKIRLSPDKDIRVQKIRIGKVPVLVLKPAGWFNTRQFTATWTGSEQYDVEQSTSGKSTIGQTNAEQFAQERLAPDHLAAGLSMCDIHLLWIHGGGYITGMKEMVYMSRAADLVRKYGITVYSPGYRLAWQKPYPAAVEDCFRVLEYLADRKKTVMVGGESAGGGLAVAVCMMARDKGINVAYQFPLYPMISNIDTQSSRDNHGKVWNTRRNHLGWRMYLRKSARKPVSPYAAPAWQTDYSGLPPCYTFVGDGEPFYAETLEYVKNLRSAGVEAEADVYHTDMHAFDMLRDDDLSREAIANFNRRFEKAVKAAEAVKATETKSAPEIEPGHMVLQTTPAT